MLWNCAAGTLDVHACTGSLNYITTASWRKAAVRHQGLWEAILFSEFLKWKHVHLRINDMVVLWPCTSPLACISSANGKEYPRSAGEASRALRLCGLTCTILFRLVRSKWSTGCFQTMWQHLETTKRLQILLLPSFGATWRDQQLASGCLYPNLGCTAWIFA